MPNRQRQEWRNWGDHPIVVSISLVASVLASAIVLFSFLTGKPSLADYYATKTPTYTPVNSAIISLPKSTNTVVVVKPIIPTATAMATVTSLRRFQVRDTYDHFVSVRPYPNTKEGEIKRLNPGDIVLCSEEVKGEEVEPGDSAWIECPSEGGYIYLQLLEPRP